MNERERLIELLKSPHKAEQLRTSGIRILREESDCPEALIADYLLANGVIVPPCKVGQMVYRVSFVHKNVTPLNVEGFIRNLASWKAHCTHLIPTWVGNQKEHIYISFSSFGKTVFLTQAEAEKALAERVKK